MIAPTMVGTSLNHYRLTKALGSGGMGEVYLAEDTHLKRQVAVKILPADLAADANRRERFEREAQAVAALNHPNIVTVHSVEHDGDTHFITMEFVEGRTLADLIQSNGLPLPRLLTLATGIVDAVVAAHGRGIIHRDLKPANVMVTAGDRVKVLDFGVAKLRDDSADPTVLPTRELTAEGRIVGTVAYMSPEQAQGKPVDERTDIFSIGVVLYELATGERPFTGDTSLSVLSSILRDTPRALSDVHPLMPRDLARILRHCLAKDPDRRYQSVKDVRNDLDELAASLRPGAVQPTAGGARAHSERRTRLVLLGAIAALALVAIGAWWYAPALSDPAPALPLLAHARLTHQTGIERSPSVSPDGEWVVFVADGEIFLQSVSGQTPINLTKSSAMEAWPAFSPDGQTIAFQSDQDGGGIFVMGRTGDSVRRLTKIGAQPAWFPDGRTIVFATVVSNGPEVRTRLSQLWVVGTTGGEPRQLVAEDAVQPRVSPTGKRIAFWNIPSSSMRPRSSVSANRDVWTVRADGGEPVRVTSHPANDWNPVWSPDGRWLYFLSNRSGSMNLWRVAIDESSGAVGGEPQPLTLPAAYVGDFSLSSDGKTAAYFSSVQTRNVGRVGFDGKARKTTDSVESITTGANNFEYMDLTKDGRLVVVASSPRGQEDVYVLAADGSGSVRQLTNDFARDRGPRWFPDGRRIAFYSDRNGYATWFVDADGSGLRQGPPPSAAQTSSNPVPSRDGTRIATSDPNSRAIAIYDASDLSRPPEVLPNFPDRTVQYGRVEDWSPDNQSLVITGIGPVAGAIGLSGVTPTQLWVYSLDTKSYRPIAEAGSNAVWLNDGRRILYSFQNRLTTIDIVTRTTVEVLTLPGEILGTPRVPADESWLYFTRGTTSGDIWLVHFSEPSR